MVSTHLLRHRILDLLVDGPSSFAAVYGAIIRQFASAQPFDTDALWEIVEDMEKLGWIRIRKAMPSGSFAVPTNEDRVSGKAAYRWLRSAIGSDLSLDEIGFWLDIDQKGRHEWDRLKESISGRGSRWTLDDFANQRTITIQAESLEIAEEALRDWLLLNPEVEVVERSRTFEPIEGFRLRSGETRSGGVKVTCKYQRHGIA